MEFSQKKSKNKTRKRSVKQGTEESKKPAGSKTKYGPRVPSCECKRSALSKYTHRRGPPYPPNDCREQTKQGNDGEWYVSTANVDGIYSWRKPTSKK